MDDRRANIDLVFRNGLKDYEVLPPPEVWDNLQPVIRVKPHKYILLKTAAAIVAITTISFFAYRLSKDVVTFPEFNYVSMNIEAGTPFLTPVSKELVDKMTIGTPVSETSQSSQTTVMQNLKSEIFTGSVHVSNLPDFQEINGMSPEMQLLQHSHFTTNLSANSEKVLVIPETLPVFMPETNSVKNTEKWSIGALASPTYYSRISTNGNDLSKMLASSEQSLMSYTGGVAVAYKINKRFTIQTGLYYSTMGQNLEDVSTFSGFEKYDYTKGANNFEVLTSSGKIKTNNADVFLIATGPVERINTEYTNDVFDPKKANLKPLNDNLLQKFSFLELPVVLRYKFVDKAIDLNLIGGLSYNMLLNNFVYAKAGGSKIQVGETEGLNPVSVSSSLGMGVEYSFSAKLSFNIEPTLRYYLNPFSSLNGADSHPYSFGLFSGLSYKF